MRKPTRLRWAFAFAATTLGLLGACTGNDNATKPDPSARSSPTTAVETTATDKVTVKDFAFSPKSIATKAGTRVTWTNEDGFDHAIRIELLSLDGPDFGPQTMPVTYSHNFDQPGTYPYICGIHNSMTGTVVVTS